jgi:hypothetical protein
MIMGSNIVTFAVISVTNTIAVSGARTMAVKSAAMPTTAKRRGSVAMPGSAITQMMSGVMITALAAQPLRPAT